MAIWLSWSLLQSNNDELDHMILELPNWEADFNTDAKFFQQQQSHKIILNGFKAWGKF